MGERSRRVTAPGTRARVIGVISDTHGLLRPDVHTALSGVELILHAGDVGGDEILIELGLIAPVRAVYGNTDAPGHPGLAAAIDIALASDRLVVNPGAAGPRRFDIVPSVARLTIEGGRADADIIALRT